MAMSAPPGLMTRRRLTLGFPEAALFKSLISSYGNGWIEVLPDLSVRDMTEKIKQNEKELSRAPNR